MVDIYADCAELSQIWKWSADPRISGITTNPSLMKKAGIANYREFAKQVLERVKDKPVSLEVLSDDWQEMEEQALILASMAPNVYVKIPITNTQGDSSKSLIKKLANLNLNVTAIMTSRQLSHIAPVMRSHHIASVFVGRIMDTGAMPHRPVPWKTKLLWASTREVFNIEEATRAGYDIITMTPDLLGKLALRGKDLTEYSLETVRQFHEDGKGISF